MKKTLPKFSAIFVVFILCSFITYAQQPVINTATANSTSIAKFAKFELDVNLTATYTNPYDYSDVSLFGIFTQPGGKKDTVDGFFMQDYTLDNSGNITASGSGTFKLRYAPTTVGTFNYILRCTDKNGTSADVAGTFECSASATQGFVRKNTTNYLNFDNGDQYIPVGENMCWQDNNVVTDYTNWLTKLTDNKGNYIRVWMSDWAFALEWKNGDNNFQGLKKYKQQSAFYLDWLLDYCSQKQVYIMLALNHHGQVSTNVNPEWNNNPYNAANGGPCANTWDFFTNTDAKNLHKNRLRYIIARYGYSKNIMSWELFNEVEWTDQFDTYKTDITNWHNEMANYIKTKDANKHLVTTSYALENNDPATWNLPSIDFTQTHYYTNSPNIESVLSNGNNKYLSQYHKPTINGEFGINADNVNLADIDPNGVYIHNSIWATAFSGGMGTAMSWWWDSYIDPQNLYRHYKPVATLVNTLKLKDENYTKKDAVITGGGAADLSVSPGASFVKANASDFTIDANGNLSPDASNLAAYLFGNQYNTQYRNPPTFSITFPVDGEFKVVTTANQQGTTAPKINIYLDGVEKLNTDAAASTTYSINVPAGAHQIKVDNLGTDWVNISNYVFTNAGSPLNTYVLHAASNLKAAGYILSNKYNWKYLQDNGGTPPAAVNGASVSFTGMENGSYFINYYDCSTGDISGNTTVTVSNGTLAFSLPAIAWDVAFTAVNNSTLPLLLNKFYGQTINNKNDIYFEVSQVINVNKIVIERSADANNYTALHTLNANASKLSGLQKFTDEKPLQGSNYYRLKIIDNDGSTQLSKTIQLNLKPGNAIVYPNPVTNQLNILATAGEGNYSISIANLNGVIIKRFSYHVSSGSENITIPFANYSAGVYIVTVTNEKQTMHIQQKVVK